VPLTYREFVLLRYVMERTGRACTRAELLEHVWGLTFDPGSNVIEVTVRRLRAKLDVGGHSGAERIETVRNVGYRFTAA
jgi:DNA-binding response OmpR family regulator